MPEVICIRCSNTAPAIEGDIPWTGATAEELRSQICKLCWQDWQEQAIMVINELSLKLFLPADQAKLEAQMREFLKLATPATNPE